MKALSIRLTSICMIIMAVITSLSFRSDQTKSEYQSDTATHVTIRKKEEEFAEVMAALISHLKINKKYQCVWALSLWNEPNGDWAYTGPKSKYPESFWPLYPAVDRRPMPTGIDLHENIRLEGTEIRLTLPARSISTLTSLPSGDLTIPAKLSLKR